MIPYGQDPAREFSRILRARKGSDPQPKTVAIVGVDAEFGKTSTDGAPPMPRRLGLPSSTINFIPRDD